jgi:hypothetical protein
MSRRFAAVLFVVLFCGSGLVMAQRYPMCEWLLHYYGGKNDETPCPR